MIYGTIKKYIYIIYDNFKINYLFINFIYFIC